MILAFELTGWDHCRNGCLHSTSKTCGGTAKNDFQCEIPAPHPKAHFKLADSYHGKTGFHHGVASGDPLPDAVIIWTRFTPKHHSDEVAIEFRIAEVYISDMFPQLARPFMLACLSLFPALLMTVCTS